MVKILVIEDDPDLREAVMEWLQFEGYEVEGAENGRVGLEMLYTNVPDLIVCDIAMPEVDGHEVLIEVRSNLDTAQIPFIFLTAAADHESYRKGMNMGADDYLTKPFTHAEVLKAVRARLDKKLTQDRLLQSQLDMFQAALSEEREKRLLKSRLVAMFSHDFRNSLASILTSSGIIRNFDDRLTPEQRGNHLDRIDGSVHMLLQMLDEMLMVAEIEGGHLACSLRTTDVRALVETIVEEFRLIHRHTHRFHFRSNGLHPIEVDPKLLRQIVTNLLSNAVKYSASDSDVQIALFEKSSTLELRIEDQGIGIPPEAIPHLFEPFQRASNVANIKGTGLGLAIVKQAVELHGGEVTVASELGKWTRFVVVLPRYRSE
ncbi:MAG: hybrid sensor histidine kinase/response regulator [Chloroflexota bacterium]|nr:MAG: hybrid sensor histidine kinase/response regulator [Chloroflexota bacterium]